MKKIFSMVLTLIMAFSGIVSQQAADAVAAIYSRISGISLYGTNADDIDFLDTLTDDDFEALYGNRGYMKDTVVVFLAESTGLAKRLRLFNSIDGRPIGYFALGNIYILKVELSSYEELENACNQLYNHEEVLLAMPGGAQHYAPDYTPNDPFFGSESWNEDNCYGSNWWLEAIDARSAWGYNEFFSKINIGIVDSGFATEHEDLSGKISFPTAKCESRNRPDDHGTHVAGIIAAKGDNSVGICGICQNSSLICVDWSADVDQLWISDLEIFFGFGYTVKAGAKVINFSLGAASNIPDGKDSYSKLLMNTEARFYSFYISYLLSRGYDFLVVQSAGNGDSLGNAVDSFNNGVFCTINSDNCFSPFIGISIHDVLRRIIVVGNAKVSDGNVFIQAQSSNVGSGVSICAPGSWIYSSSVSEDGYLYMSGTSMSAPVVTAVAALVWSVNPEFTGLQVKHLVCSPLNTKYTVEPAANHYWEHLEYPTYNLVNAKLAVEAAIAESFSASKVSGQIKNSDGVGIKAEYKITGDKNCVFESNSSGEFSFVLPNGNYNVSIIAEGYEPFSSDFTISGDEISDFSLVLTSSAVVPESVDGEYDIGFEFPSEDEMIFC